MGSATSSDTTTGGPNSKEYDRVAKYDRCKTLYGRFTLVLRMLDVECGMLMWK